MPRECPATVRTARRGDLPAACGVLDGAALQVDTEHVRRAIATGDVFVAESSAGTVLGALVLDGPEITAVAVRRRRRDQGIGTALVEAAGRERERLVAEFDPRVRPFWEGLGFAVEPLDTGRFRGYRNA